MSRSAKGSKGPGYEFDARKQGKPRGWVSAGEFAKRQMSRFGRRRDKTITEDEKNDLELPSHEDDPRGS
jgi:hypothetical protein